MNLFDVEIAPNAGFFKTDLPGIVDQSETALQGLRMPKIRNLVLHRTGMPIDKLAEQQVLFVRHIAIKDTARWPTATLDLRAVTTHQDMLEGAVLPVEDLPSQNIDPRSVVMYRITDPLKIEKPERMWTTDIDTFLQMYEVDPNGKVIIVSSLAEIADTGGGVVLDHMDTNGISVRQVREVNFPKEQIWGEIPFVDLF